MITDDEYREYALELEHIGKSHGDIAQGMLRVAYNWHRMKDLAKPVSRRRGATACLREAVDYTTNNHAGCVLV